MRNQRSGFAKLEELVKTRNDKTLTTQPSPKQSKTARSYQPSSFVMRKTIELMNQQYQDKVDKDK